MELIKLKEEDFKSKMFIPVVITEGAFLCGGFLRDKFIGKAFSDIDFFFVDDSAIKLFETTNNLKKPIFETKNAKTYDVNNNILQIIKLHYASLEEILDSFDFNICQFGMNSNKEIFATKEAIISSLRGHLGVHKIQKG
jgi:hypothetical protein